LSIPPDLIRVAEQLIGPTLAKRNDQTRQALYKRQYEAEKAGRLGEAFYATDQQDACVAEIEARANIIWNAYRRVVADGRILWTDGVRAEILTRIGKMLDVETPYVEELARQVIVGHGHGFALFLHDARPALEQRIAAEMDLFALQHRPVGASVRDKLQAPRYDGPREHWIRVDRAMNQSPPDYLAAAREAVNGVEGLAKIVVASPTDTLGDCIKLLRKSERLDGALAKGLDSLWGFANTHFRHGAHATRSLSEAETDYVIESCEAATKLLLSLDALIE
jgi:hypothetical protein